MTLSSLDDYPVHQAAEFIAHPATSDRNFYDRYYFNMHPSSGDWFAIFGYGQYPNLGVVDAFIDVRRDGSQHIVRASAPLVDRGDLSVGPFRIEVLEPLRRLRVVVEPTEHSVAMDVTWEGHIPAVVEPRQYMRSKGKVVFDTQRLAQTGSWSGTLSVGGTDLAVAPEHCWGTRDRSWGVRPVGEPESDGIRQGGTRPRRHVELLPDAVRGPRHHVHLPRARRRGAPAGAGRAGLGRSRPPGRAAGPLRARAPSHPGDPRHRPLRAPVPRRGDRDHVQAAAGQLRLHRHRLRHRRRLASRDVPRTRAGDPGPRPGGRGGPGASPSTASSTMSPSSPTAATGYGLLEHGFFGPYRHYGLLDGAMGAPAD